MSDYMNDKNSRFEIHVDQPTRTLPPVESAAAPRRRRSDRYQAADAAPVQETVPVVKMPQDVQQPAAMMQQTRVQPVYPPAENQEALSQGVPRPASLRAADQRAAGQTPAPRSVRRPVNAPGFAQQPPLNAPINTGAEEQPQPWAHRPREVQPVKNHVAPEKPARKNPALLIALIAVLVIAMLVLGFHLIPADQTTVLGQIKIAVTDALSGVFGGEQASEPETQETPVPAQDLSATNTTGTAPMDVVFTLITGKEASDVRVVDEDGFPMDNVLAISTDNASARIWVLTLSMSEGYEGLVQIQVCHDGEWLNTGLTQELAIASPAVQPVDAQLAATPTAEPTETPEPMEEPTSTPEPIVTPEPEETVAPTQIPLSALEATEVPTEEPSEAPVATASPTPTLAPTPTPTIPPAVTEAPTATPVPVLEAEAADSADPSKLIASETVYTGTSTKKLNGYDRDLRDVLNMPAAGKYITQPYGVLTFRGDAFRQNASVGDVDAPLTGMEVVWQAEAGSVRGASTTYYGIGWTGQPAIIKWSKEVRGSTNMTEEKRGTSAMKEVIIAGMDGNIYFLDLSDGQPTRDAIKVGYPMKGTPSLHPLGFPMMTVGQYARKMKSGTGEIGLRFYNLLDQKQIDMIDGLDGKRNRPLNGVGAFDTSALIDPASDTLVTVGTNGALYTVKLGTEFDYNKGTFKIDPTTVMLVTKGKDQKDKDVAVESALASYGKYVFYADVSGLLRCVDTSSMKTVWAVDTGDAVQAAIALDFDEEGTLWLYTANTLDSRGKTGDCQIRRFNAMTGELDWTRKIPVAKEKSSKSTLIPGAVASPVIGDHQLGELVYFTLSNVGEDADSTVPAELVALNKTTGKIVWSCELDDYSYSSPVAVYDTEGNGWIIQASASGKLLLLEGLTGDVVSELQLDGTIEASPAVYNDMLVIGTTGKGTSFIYGVKLK